jgi:hypothetical protein
VFGPSISTLLRIVVAPKTMRHGGALLPPVPAPVAALVVGAVAVQRHEHGRGPAKAFAPASGTTPPIVEAGVERAGPGDDRAVAHPSVDLRRPAGAALVLAAAALVPWIAILARTLPPRVVSHHWDVAWIGFDVGLVVALGATGWATLRRRPWLQGAAMASATMLVVDAWFDVVTSAPGAARGQAVLLAAGGDRRLRPGSGG